MHIFAKKIQGLFKDFSRPSPTIFKDYIKSISYTVVNINGDIIHKAKYFYFKKLK